MPFTADNTNVNYGRHNGVFSVLQRKQGNLIKANCQAHVLHNAAKHAAGSLSTDIEAFVLRVYSYFSGEAKRTAQLKEFFEFVGSEYLKILKHVPTRWISLFAALERCLRNFDALKSYFQSSDTCPKFLEQFFCYEDDDVLPYCVAQLHFAHHILDVFRVATLRLESDSLTVSELYKLMDDLRYSLQSRIDDQFFGSMVRRAMRQLNPTECRKLRDESIDFLQTAVVYIEKYFDFSENSIFKKLAIFNLEASFSYESLLAVVEDLPIHHSINEDALYDEFKVLERCFDELNQSDSPDSSTEPVVKWVSFFKSTKAISHLPNLRKILCFCYSIAPSNAFCERVFSLMKNKATDVRNRMNIDLLRSELMITVNFNATCQEFYEMILANDKLLKAAKSNAKYIFKK